MTANTMKRTIHTLHNKTTIKDDSEEIVKNMIRRNTNIQIEAKELEDSEESDGEPIVEGNFSKDEEPIVEGNISKDKEELIKKVLDNLKLLKGFDQETMY